MVTLKMSCLGSKMAGRLGPLFVFGVPMDPVLAWPRCHLAAQAPSPSCYRPDIFSIINKY